MNHVHEFDRSGFTDMFKFKEMQIMSQTTFKSLDEAKASESDDTAPDKNDSGLLEGNGSVAECLASMEEYGYESISCCATKLWSYYYHRDFITNTPIELIGNAVKESKGIIMGAASYDPFRIMESLREIEEGVKEYGFNYVWFHPLSFGVSPADRRCYPLYAKCMELDIAVGFQVGHSAEVLPSNFGRPMEADAVAIDFPELRINLSHTGWPWVDEWCSMIWRHPNVFGDISAYYASTLDEKLVKFMDSSRGRDKVLFGTNGLGLKRCKEEFLSLDIKEETKRKVLYENAKRFLKIEG